jgi:hypothetical protein
MTTKQQPTKKKKIMKFYKYKWYFSLDGFMNLFFFFLIRLINKEYCSVTVLRVLF